MDKKYIFVIKFQDCVGNEFEISSAERLSSGVFDSHEAAKKAADDLTLYKVILTYRHYLGDDYDSDDAWEEVIDSLNGLGGSEGCLDDEPAVFLSYSAAQSYAYCHVDDDEYEDEDGVIHSMHGMYGIVKMEDFEIEIEEISN